MSKLFGWFHKDCGMGLSESEIHEIRNIVLEEEGFKWIPVSERLPDEEGGSLTENVLVTAIGFLEPLIGYYHYRSDQWYRESGQAIKVIAWMPKPKAYNPNP